MPRYDLHCHSTHSDGLLAPSAVVARAAARGVDVLALTDHDEVSGLAEARSAAADAGIELVCGAELSVSWDDATLHVVALGIDPTHPVLAAGLDEIRAGRATRARRIADALAAAGIQGAYEGAMKYVTSERLVSRTHFARYLVEAGYARDMKGRLQAIPDAWQSRLRPASVGDAFRRRRLDSRGRGSGGHRTPGPLQDRRREHAPSPRSVSRPRRRCDRSRLVVAHAGAVRRVRDLCAGIRAARVLRLGLARSRGELDGSRRRSRNAAGCRAGLERLVAVASMIQDALRP